MIARAASLWMLLSGLPSEAQTRARCAARYPIAPWQRPARQKLGFGTSRRSPPASLVVGDDAQHGDRHAGDNAVDFP